MATRTRLQRISAQMGSDLRLLYAQSAGFFEDADLEAARTPQSGFDIDLLRVEGMAALTQAIANRLKTRYGDIDCPGAPRLRLAPS